MINHPTPMCLSQQLPGMPLWGTFEMHGSSSEYFLYYLLVCLFISILRNLKETSLNHI